MIKTSVHRWGTPRGPVDQFSGLRKKSGARELVARHTEQAAKEAQVAAIEAATVEPLEPTSAAVAAHAPRHEPADLPAEALVERGNDYDTMDHAALVALLRQRDADAELKVEVGKELYICNQSRRRWEATAEVRRQEIERLEAKLREKDSRRGEMQEYPFDGHGAPSWF